VEAFELVVIDSAGAPLFEVIVPARASARRLTLVLAGDGSERAPFRAVIVDG
jgi:hypothetical protein